MKKRIVIVVVEGVVIVVALVIIGGRQTLPIQVADHFKFYCKQTPKRKPKFHLKYSHNYLLNDMTGPHTCYHLFIHPTKSLNAGYPRLTNASDIDASNSWYSTLSLFLTCSATYLLLV